MVLWQRFDEFHPGTSFVAWARIAQHKVMDFHKKRGRHVAFTANLRKSLMEELAGHASETSEATSRPFRMHGPAGGERPTNPDALLYRRIPIRQVADAMGRSPKSVQPLYRIRKWLLDCIRRELDRSELACHARHILKQEDGP